MHLDRITTRTLLDALPGVAYVVDLEGRILACGQGPWREFAEANGAPALADPRVVTGRTLTEFIEGEAAREADACIRRSLLLSRRDRVAYDFRCDSPDRIRRMRMHIRLLRDGGEPQAFLYQSLLLSERQRPALPLFAPRLPGLLDEESPIVTACSYCKRLRHPSMLQVWLTPEEYAGNGGRNDARVSHGICGDCYARVNAEFFGEPERS
ncbi:MAG: hypothetical protein M0R74_09405 [Dehalococcoidia bacterium]|nr:hypothetical protein [Dehalococcoidia bacterium]